MQSSIVLRGFIEKTGTDSSQRGTEKGQETMGSSSTTGNYGRM